MKDLGPIYKCQDCGAGFFTHKWAKDHYETSIWGLDQQGNKVPQQQHSVIQVAEPTQDYLVWTK